MCKSSQCRCMPGFCATAGVCNERKQDNVAHVADTCNRDTGGSCRFFGCSSYRGAVDCIDGGCVCKAGYCSADDGSCHQPKARIKAHVVPVNLQQRNFPSSQAESAQRFCSRTILVESCGVMLPRAKDSFNLFPDSFQICPGGQSSHWTLLQWWWLSRSYCDHGGPSSFGEFEINPTCRCDLKCFWWNLGFFYLHVCQGRQHKGQVF